MKINFTNHAKRKFKILQEYGLSLTKKQVEDTVKNPEIILEGKHNRFIAQKTLDNGHLLRVIFEKENKETRIITFYPARRDRYESKL